MAHKKLAPAATHEIMRRSIGSGRSGALPGLIEMLLADAVLQGGRVQGGRAGSGVWSGGLMLLALRR